MVGDERIAGILRDRVQAVIFAYESGLVESGVAMPEKGPV
jgi:hypothetical protein